MIAVTHPVASRAVKSAVSLGRVIRRCVRALMEARMRKAVAKGLNLFLLLRDAFAEARQARTKLEAELFRGRYRLTSKHDDDLPIVR